MKKCLAILAVILLFGCNATGPQATLDKVAQAMQDNNTQEFLAQFDMTQYANNHLKNLAAADDALSTLNTIGNLFGMGNLDELIGSVVDIKSRITEQFNRGVATGELMAECRASLKPDCPWVPESLRKATVININNAAAIAKITTPAQITSWVAFRNINNHWVIVGQTALEATARTMAAGTPATGTPGQGVPATKPSTAGATRL